MTWLYIFLVVAGLFILVEFITRDNSVCAKALKDFKKNPQNWKRADYTVKGDFVHNSRRMSISASAFYALDAKDNNTGTYESMVSFNDSQQMFYAGILKGREVAKAQKVLEEALNADKIAKQEAEKKRQEAEREAKVSMAASKKVKDFGTF